MSSEIGDNIFVVCIHDVSPKYDKCITEQINMLTQLVENKLSLAIIPEEMNASWSTTCKNYIDIVSQYELILHGYTHSRDFSYGLLSALCGHVDEFAKAKPEQALNKMLAGQKVLENIFGRKAKGFIPPAWRFGSVGLELARKASLEYIVGFTVSRHINAIYPLKLSTMSWDWGEIACMEKIVKLIPWMLSCTGKSIPVVVLHPVDLKRGYFENALKLIKKYLASGYEPVSFGEVWELNND